MAKDTEVSTPEEVVEDDAGGLSTPLTPEEVAGVISPVGLLDKTGEPDIPDVMPSEEPDKVPEAEDDVTEEPEEVEETEEVEPEPEPEPTDTDNVQKPEWDKPKQVQDQTIANLKKEVEALKLGEPDKPSQPVTETPFVALDEYSGPDDTSKSVNALHDEVAALAEQFRQTENEAAYNRLLGKACEEVGEEHRNAIHAEVQTTFTKRGYGPGNYPDPDQTEDIIFRAGYRLTLDAAKPTKKRTKPTKRRADSGKGGGPVSTTTPVKEGTSIAVDAQDLERLSRGEYPPGWIR